MAPIRQKAAAVKSDGPLVTRFKLVKKEQADDVCSIAESQVTAPSPDIPSGASTATVVTAAAAQSSLSSMAMDAAATAPGNVTMDAHAMARIEEAE